MGTRTNHQPGPVFDPAITAEHQRVLEAAQSRLLPPHSPRPRPGTRWRQQPVDTAGTLIAFLIIAFMGWMLVFALAGTVLGPSGGLVGCLLLPVAIVTPIWYVRKVAGERLSDKVLRIHHGKYLRPEEFDTESGALMARAQHAVRTVLTSEVHKQGLIDNIGSTVLLPSYLWELAQILYDQTSLRAEQSAAAGGVMTEELQAVLTPQQEALRRSVMTVTARVDRLEEYAHRVQLAESAYKARVLMNSNDKYRDLLARTDDQEALADLRTGVDDAETTLRASLRAAIAAGETLALS